jgi:hypothetical protein
MTVLRVKTMGRLPGTTDIKTMRYADMNMLVRILSDSRPDNREIFLFVAAG